MKKLKLLILLFGFSKGHNTSPFFPMKVLFSLSLFSPLKSIFLKIYFKNLTDLFSKTLASHPGMEVPEAVR